MQKPHTYFTLKVFLVINLSLKILNIVTVNSQFLQLCGELCTQSLENVLKKLQLYHKLLKINFNLQSQSSKMDKSIT